MPDGRVRTPLDDFDAANLQHAEILMRRTGRINGINKISTFLPRLPHRRFLHLVLLDYLDQPIDTDAYIDPSDGKQLTWTSRPLEFGPGSGVPYADGIPDGYDSDLNWVNRSMRMRWAFASSYQAVPSAWQPDWPAPRFIPVKNTPHLFQQNGSVIGLSSGRRITEVLHTGNKVWVHEEFDRDRVRHLYFGYDDARTDKLMFDGSVNNYASGGAAPSVVPERGNFHWMQPYVPLDRFPIPLGGLGDQTPVSQRFRWTYGGLSGIDYGPFSFE